MLNCTVILADTQLSQPLILFLSGAPYLFHPRFPLLFPALRTSFVYDLELQYFGSPFFASRARSSGCGLHFALALIQYFRG